MQPKDDPPPLAPVLAGGVFPDHYDTWSYQQAQELIEIAADPAQDTSGGDSGSSRRASGRLPGVPPLNATPVGEGPGGAYFVNRTTTVAYQMATGLASTASKQGAPPGH